MEKALPRYGIGLIEMGEWAHDQGIAEDSNRAQAVYWAFADHRRLSEEVKLQYPGLLTPNSPGQLPDVERVFLRALPPV